MLRAIAQHFVIADIRRGITDVIRHRAGEQERHLRDDAQLAAILSQVKGADVESVNGQTASLKFVEARDQFGNGRLPRAGVPDQSQSLSGL